MKPGDLVRWATWPNDTRIGMVLRLYNKEAEILWGDGKTTQWDIDCFEVIK